MKQNKDNLFMFIILKDIDQLRDPSKRVITSRNLSIVLLKKYFDAKLTID